jgi:DNA polymerase-3 subunit beta
VSAAESAAAVVCGNSRSRVRIVPWTDLPSVLAIDSGIASVEISGGDCLMLLEPLRAAESEATRFYLCGIFLHSIDNRLVAVCTDGVRLIRTSVPAGKFSEGRDLIVPREAAAVLARLVKSTRPGRVTLHRSRTLLAVTCPDFEFTTRLIDSRYPPYENVIPAASPNSVACNRAELHAVLARVAAVATVDPPLVALSFDRTPQLKVFLARQANDGSDCIASETTGSAKVAVPLPQLAAMLGEFASERVRIEAASGQQPLVIHGDGEKLALISPSAWNFNSEKEEIAATVV